MPKRTEYADAESRLRAALLHIHEIAADVFRASLRAPQGEEARAYLMNYAKFKKSGGASTALSTLESMLASFVAGCATSIISNPIWVINTQQTVRSTLRSEQADDSSKVVFLKKFGFFQTLMQIINSGGASTLFSGLSPALLLVINPILQYTLFEQLKNMIVQRRMVRKAFFASVRSASGDPPALPPPFRLSDLDYFWLGAVSKLFATTLTYPCLTVKSRMQSGQAVGKRYKSCLNGIVTIVQEEGVKGFYKGIGPKLTQSVLTAAVLFVSKEKVYQVTKNILQSAAKSATV